MKIEAFFLNFFCEDTEMEKFFLELNSWGNGGIGGPRKKNLPYTKIAGRVISFVFMRPNGKHNHFWINMKYVPSSHYKLHLSNKVAVKRI